MTLSFRHLTEGEARSLISRYGSRHTLVVRVRKERGEERRMVCRYYGHRSRSADTMVVWDIEAGAPRTVKLGRVRR